VGIITGGIRIYDKLNVAGRPKVLITTSTWATRSNGDEVSCSVHTVVAEFDTPETARAAVEDINSQPVVHGIEQKAMYLGK
jgi:hypothetical protein